MPPKMLEHAIMILSLNFLIRSSIDSFPCIKIRIRKANGAKERMVDLLFRVIVWQAFQKNLKVFVKERLWSNCGFNEYRK